MATFNRDHSFGNHVIAGLDHPFSRVCRRHDRVFRHLERNVGAHRQHSGILRNQPPGHDRHRRLYSWIVFSVETSRGGHGSTALLFTDVFRFLSFTEAASVRLSHSQFPFSSLLGRARHARRLASARARVARFLFLDLGRRKHPPLAVELGKKDRKVGKLRIAATR